MRRQGGAPPLAVHNLTQLVYRLRTVIYVSDADGRVRPVRVVSTTQHFLKKARDLAERESVSSRCQLVCDPASVHNIAKHILHVQQSVSTLCTKTLAAVKLELPSSRGV